ncbi:MAG TPA: HAD hydrolase family protein [Kiritimatiellia bacterium]|nr:HAD hydrolase family protein [Kiritimatiellia bacterium]
MNLSAEQRAANVRAIILDVDGVLTDGGLIYGPEGESKVFNVRDGHALVMARMAGIRTAFLTGRRSEVVKRRAEELKIDALRDGVTHKKSAMRELLKELDVQSMQVCYAGDDLVDLPVLNEVGFPVTVADAVDEVKNAAVWISKNSGGRGAVRELIEYILKAKGLWAEIVRKHEKEKYE